MFTRLTCVFADFKRAEAVLLDSHHTHLARMDRVAGSRAGTNYLNADWLAKGKHKLNLRKLPVIDAALW